MFYQLQMKSWENKCSKLRHIKCDYYRWFPVYDDPSLQWDRSDMHAVEIKFGFQIWILWQLPDNCMVARKTPANVQQQIVLLSCAVWKVRWIRCLLAHSIFNF